MQRLQDQSISNQNMNTETVTPTEQTPAVAEKKFAVFRDNHRVSSSEYNAAKEAQHEFSYWQGILKRWPDGTHLSIRELKWRRKEKETPAVEEVQATTQPEQTPQ